VKLLVTGLPRSGTSWFARAIGAHPDIKYVHEPDNVDLTALGAVVARRCDYAKVLPPGARSRPFEILWDLSYAGGWPRGRTGRWVERFLRIRKVPLGLREIVALAFAEVASHRTPDRPHVLVKSVRSLGATEWIEARYGPRILVVWRHPINMLGSFLERGWSRSDYVMQPILERFDGTDVWRAPASQPEEVMQILCARLELQFAIASRHPDWRMFRHEDVARAPSERFRAVFADIGIPWADEVDVFLRKSNRRGTGYQTDRVAADEPLSWRKRVTDEQLAAALPVLRRFAKLPDATAPFGELLEEVEREIAPR